MGNPDQTPVNIFGGTNPNGAFFDPVAAEFTPSPYPLLRVSVWSVPTSVALPAGLALRGGLALRRRRSV